MKPLHVRRRLVSAVAAAGLLALAAGCSGSADPGSPKSGGRGAGAGDKAEPTAAVPTQAQLKKALVTKVEAEGYEATDNNGPAVRPQADKPECTALADMTASGTDRTPSARAWASRTYGSTSAPGLAVTTSLSSYEGRGAQQTVDGVRKAVAACPDGFTTTGNNGGSTVKYVSVKGEQAAKSGDDSVAWQMTGESQGRQVPMHLTLVREGSTVALFFTLHLTDPEKAKLPQDLLDAQLSKLADAAG
ncbi:hypothetical protein [Streptomyces sp. 8N706]|uniref:hypothetical protein n=1 Tax=Streptomyces sp. 8N706 TaxID=3457416 RepID=UPI003FD53503